MNVWISVKNRLPEHGETVLAIREARNSEGKLLDNVYMLVQFKTNKFYWIIPNSFLHPEVEVTYWTALPKPINKVKKSVW